MQHDARGIAFIGIVSVVAFATDGGDSRSFSGALFLAPARRMLEPDGEDGEGDEGDLPDAPEAFVVSFYVNDALYHETTVDADTLVPWPADPPSEEGQSPFLAWYAEGESTPFSPYRLITSDIRLDARFSDSHLVTFFDTDGSELERIELPADETVPKPTADVTLSMDATVLRRYLEGDEDTPFDFGELTDANLSLYPYVGEMAQAVFITQSTEVPPQSGEPGFLAQEPTGTLIREGYNFERWSAEPDGEAFQFASTPITGTQYIYAV